jgi:dTDP-4-dehydrorhamnose reductase
VFSGLAGCYGETCPPDPTTPYGAAKAAAETEVRGLDPAAVIARTVTDLASALLELASSSYSGTHHVAGADAISRHELGVLIARRDGLDEARRRPAAAPRPAFPAPSRYAWTAP